MTRNEKLVLSLAVAALIISIVCLFVVTVHLGLVSLDDFRLLALVVGVTLLACVIWRALVWLDAVTYECWKRSIGRSDTKWVCAFVLISLSAVAIAGETIVPKTVVRPKVDTIPPQGPPNNPLVQWPVIREPQKTPHSRLPPPEFDHEFRGLQGIIVHQGTSDEVRLNCLRPSHINLFGCAYLPKHANGELCVVWMVNDDVLKQYDYPYETLWRHERGHCNGWHHDDPIVKR